MISLSLSEIKALYAKAENALKLYERIGLDNLVSAINELRYAGHHVIEAETTKAGDNQEEHLFKAARHCERAAFDAKEATIVHLLEFVSSFREYGITESEMVSLVPEWPAFMKSAIDAQRVLEEAGHVKNADSESLDAAIDTLLSVREKLLAAESRIMAARKSRLDELEAQKRSIAEVQAIEAENRDKAREIFGVRQFLISFAISAGGTFIGLCGTLVAVYCEFENHRSIGIVTGILGLLFVVWGVYSWAERHLLTDDARNLIRTGLNS